MRISLLQFLIALLFNNISLAISSHAQKVLESVISVKANQQDVKTVLNTIEKQARVKFIFSSNLVKAERKISINIHNQRLDKVLNSILSPLNLGYEVVGNQIIVKRVKPESYTPGEVTPNLDPRITLYFIDREISGLVKDVHGSPLPGVAVVIKGTNKGTTTDGEGNFRLVIPNGEVTLVLSYVGFAGKETIVSANQTSLSIELTEDTKSLSEVVVVGYGTAKKTELTGAVAIVKVAELTQQPNAQLTNQLQGRASGVTVLGSGQPGEQPQIRIRGINTFGNNTPLFVVDGVPTSNIFDLNANDVETMQVLKDAGSASIYGSRAANGVVIITTKRGSGKVKVSYDAYYGSQSVPGGNVWDILSPQGMADLKWMALKNSGTTTFADAQYGSDPNRPVLPYYIVPSGAKQSDVDLSKYYVNPNYTDKADYDNFYRIVRANHAGTDWFHEVFKAAPITNHNLSVSGGGAQGNYFLSFNYMNQQGNLLKTYLKRYTLRTNSIYNISKSVRIGENLAFSLVDNPRSGILEEGSAIGHAYRNQPIIPVYDVMNNYAGSFGSGMGNAKNPVAIRERTRNNRGLSLRTLGNVFAEVDIIRGLTFRTSFGGEIYSGYSHSFSYPEYENAENGTNNSYSENSYFGYNWTWTNTLTYERKFGEHNLKLLAGYESYSNYGRNLTGTTQGYFSFDPNYTNLGTGSGTQTNGSGSYADALMSKIGRIDYTFKDRYLVSATLRHDGSSRFLRTQYGLFPAVSAGWRVSEESFLKSIPWLSELKIRGGYGVMGNQINVDPANGFTLYGQNRSHSFYDISGTGNSTVMGFQRTRIGNPDAKWESNVNSNIGFDASLFNNAVEITVDYYRKEVRDLLFNPTLPGTVGQGDVPFRNVAKMKNDGIDLSISGEKRVSQSLKLNATVNFTSYNNKILNISDGIDYFDLESRRFNGSYIVRNAVGHSIGQYFGYKIDGFWNSQSEIEAANAAAAAKTGVATTVYQQDVKPGRFRYADVNGDGLVNSEDRTFLGNPNPKFSYGINLGATYKGFDVGIFLYGVQGNQIWNQLKWWHDFYANFQGAKSNTALYDSWRPDHTNASAPIQENSGSFSTTDVPNSYYVENGAYLRAKNAQIGYTLPTEFVKKTRLSKVRIYLQFANLFTITKYSGLDPEVGGGTQSFGIDEGSYPNTRQFLGGINLSF